MKPPKVAQTINLKFPPRLLSASTEAVKAYMRQIGSKGGKKSRRKLTKKQAKEMAEARWKNARK